MTLWLALAALLPGLAGPAFAQDEDLAVLIYQGTERIYTLHLPPDRRGPVPIVVALHGLDQRVADLRRYWTMDGVADREGFAVLYPQAVSGRWAYADTRPVSGPDGRLVDDIGFIAALLDKLQADGVADPVHIFVVGESNGGLMAWTLACQMSGRLTGVASVITGMIERQAELCHPKRLTPLLVIAGTEDWTQAYDGAMGQGYRLMPFRKPWSSGAACVAAPASTWTRCPGTSQRTGPVQYGSRGPSARTRRPSNLYALRVAATFCRPSPH